MDLSSLCSKLLPGFTTLGFKDERRSKGESGERGPGGSSMVALTHLLSGLCPDPNLKVMAMKLPRTSSPWPSALCWWEGLSSVLPGILWMSCCWDPWSQVMV